MVPTLTQIKPRRSQADRRDESERRLLAAAAELVVEHGMGAATFEKIGARAGYSRGLVTQRFGSKRGLIEALIHQLQGRLGGLLEDRRGIVDCGDKGRGIDLKKQVAFFDSLIILNRDLDDRPRHPRSDADHVGSDLGIPRPRTIYITRIQQ